MQLKRGGDEIALGVVGMVPGFWLFLDHEVGIVTSIHSLDDGLRNSDIGRLRKFGRGLLNSSIVWGSVIGIRIRQSLVSRSRVRIHVKS